MVSTSFMKGFDKSAASKEHMFDMVRKAVSKRLGKVYPHGAGPRTNYELAVKTDKQIENIKALLKKKDDVKRALVRSGKSTSPEMHKERDTVQNFFLDLYKTHRTFKSSAKTLSKKKLPSFRNQADGKY